MFSIITPLDPSRLRQFKVTKRAYDEMPQTKEFLVPTRNESVVRQYFDEHDLHKDAQIISYSIDGAFNVAKALNIGTRAAKYPHIIITSPEVRPITPVLDEFEKILGTNVICQVWDENENGKVVRSLVNSGKRSESPRMYFLAMFNKSDIEKINGWDENFLGGYAHEDNDFGARWNRANIPFIVRDDIQGRHQYHTRSENIPGGLQVNRRKLQENNATGVIRPKKGLVTLESSDGVRAPKRLLINDTLSPSGQVTFWHKLQEWFELEFVGGDYSTLAATADPRAYGASLIIRKAAYFPPLAASEDIPTIGFIQEILEGRKRATLDAVIQGCPRIVVDSEFTKSHYSEHPNIVVIPPSTDFELFKPGDKVALMREFGLPDNAVCWVGASQGPEGHIKNFELFLDIVARTPDTTYVAVFKDGEPDYKPPNLRTYVRLSLSELARVMGACKMGLCTSRIESLHFAGIEMGACGLPIVAPPVGTYWQRGDIPGALVNEGDDWVETIQRVLAETYDPQGVRDYWHKEYNESAIKEQWAKLIEEVESGNLGP